MAVPVEPEYKLRICPYNVAHRVAHTKYAQHITKCAKAYDDSALITCAFYAGHRVEREHYIQHISSDCEYADHKVLNEVILPRIRSHHADNKNGTAAKSDPLQNKDYDYDGDWD